MPIPEVIPITHEPDHRTDTIGRYADGQFLASVTYAFPEGYRPDDGWEEHKRLYAILHTFDGEGRHRDSEIWCAGTWAEQQRGRHGDGSALARAESHLAKLLDRLPGLTYTDIAIRPFHLTVDGVRFGLITEHHADEPDPDAADWAELYPDNLGFGPPWDGHYDT